MAIVFVCFVSVSASLGTTRGVDVVDRAAKLDSIYQRARDAVASEFQAEYRYRRQPAPDLRDEYNASAARLTDALDELERSGSARDRATARRIDITHREYLRVDARMFAALDRGQGDAITPADSRRARALYRDVRDAVDAAAAAHRRDAGRSLDDLRAQSRFVSRWVPVVGGIGIALVLFFTAVMFWYRRLVREATRREIARLEHAALVDNLTGLSNHRALHEALPNVAAEARTTGTPVSIVAFDLDGLKEINDTRGHHDGDDLIRRFAAGLAATLPPGGRAFRVGGDEFVALLEGATAVDAFHYTQHLQTHLAPPQEGIRARTVEQGFEPTHVTAGVSDLTAADGDPERALQHADLALIEAKRLGHRGLIWSVGIETAASADSGQTPDHRRFLATALAKAVDAKDSYTRSHCETVSQLCVIIAEQLGMEPVEIERLRLAGLLHDVGKIGVPDSILQKPDKLTDDEYAQMQLHSTLGASIVAAAQLDEEATWVRHHHERLDGRGYPHGLGGPDIPLQSRIIFVADAFEAITSDRPYRAGSPASDALAELRRCAGTQFDPDCVAALERALQIVGPDAIVPASVLSDRRRSRQAAGVEHGESDDKAA